VDVKDLVKGADSIQFCLSKGLCAPVGSILCGTKEFITEAKRKRKMLGGGLRQSGILAAAGLISLHKMTKRLYEDHERAKRLFDGLKSVPGIKVLSCNTNFVWFEITDPKITVTGLGEKLKLHNIIVSNSYEKERKIRCAIHYWINDESIQKVIDALHHIMKNTSKL